MTCAHDCALRPIFTRKRGSQGEDGTRQTEQGLRHEYLQHEGARTRYGTNIGDVRVAWNLELGYRNAGWELADPCISFPSRHTHNVFCPGSRVMVIGSWEDLVVLRPSYYREQQLHGGHVQPNGLRRVRSAELTAVQSNTGVG